MKAYLYRKAGALGVATHWSTVPLEHAEDFEILGIGEWINGRESAFLYANCPYSDDIEQIHPFGRQ